MLFTTKDCNLGENQRLNVSLYGIGYKCVAAIALSLVSRLHSPAFLARCRKPFFLHSARKAGEWSLGTRLIALTPVNTHLQTQAELSLILSLSAPVFTLLVVRIVSLAAHKSRSRETGNEARQSL